MAHLDLSIPKAHITSEKEMQAPYCGMCIYYILLKCSFDRILSCICADLSALILKVPKNLHTEIEGVHFDLSSKPHNQFQ